MKIQVYISFGKILPKWLPFLKEEKYSQVSQWLILHYFIGTTLDWYGLRAIKFSLGAKK